MSQLSYEERKQLKEEKRGRAHNAARKARIFKMLLLVVGIGGVAAVIIVLVFISITSRAPRVGEFAPSQGAEHVVPGQLAPYSHSTNPPTSGWHYPTPLSGGFYEEEQADGYLIHSMEHGGVILWYKPDVSEGEKQQLRELYSDFKRSKFIVAPRMAMDTKYAITAWEYTDRFDQFDRLRIEAFIRGNANRGPEVAPM